jgi:hypothetical protein
MYSSKDIEHLAIEQQKARAGFQLVVSDALREGPYMVQAGT